MIKKFFTLIISLIAILVLGTVASADPASAVAGGDFLLKYNFENGKLTDKTDAGFWWEFQAISYKNFGDNGQAYLQIKATRDDSLFAAGFGYTYKVNDKLSFTWRNDANGEFLTDGQVIGNGCDWHKLAESDLNFFNRIFMKRTEVKMDTSIIPGANLTLAFVPEDEGNSLPWQLLLKGKYTNDLFNIGFGYTNTREGYKDFKDKRPLYSLYGEIYPSANQKYYWEYIQGGPWLAKATIELAPFTLKATYGNDMWYHKAGHPDYLSNSLDCALDYALSANKTISVEAAYFLGTYQDGLANTTVGLTIGPLSAAICHDFGGNTFKPIERDGYPYTKLIGKYSLDGTNTLVSEYNLNTNVFTTELYVRFW